MLATISLQLPTVAVFEHFQAKTGCSSLSDVRSQGHHHHLYLYSLAFTTRRLLMSRAAFLYLLSQLSQPLLVLWLHNGSVAFSYKSSFLVLLF